MNCKFPIIINGKEYESHNTNTNTNYIHLIAISLKFSNICTSIYSLIHLISFLKTFTKEKIILRIVYQIFNISEH